MPATLVSSPNKMFLCGFRNHLREMTTREGVDTKLSCLVHVSVTFQLLMCARIHGAKV